MKGVENATQMNFKPHLQLQSETDRRAADEKKKEEEERKERKEGKKRLPP